MKHFCNRSILTAAFCVGFSSIAAQPGWSQPPVGYPDDLNVVQNVDLTKIRFPIICLTNRQKTGAAYSSVVKETSKDVPEMFLRYCTVDAAKHELGKRPDFICETENGQAADLNKYLSSSPPGSTKRFLLFVHGYNLKFTDSLPAVAQLAFDIDRHAAPVSFSWPSGEGPQYVAALSNSKQSGRSLAKGIELIQSKAGGNIEVDLVCHSLGAQMVLEALEELDKSEFSGLAGKLKLSNVVFIAPDVSVDDFKAALDWPILQTSRRITLYADSNDAVLKSGSNFLTQNARIGNKIDFKHLRVETVDVTPISSTLAPLDAHTSVLNKPVGLMDLYQLLKLDLPALKRNLYWVQGVWLLRK